MELAHRIDKQDIIDVVTMSVWMVGSRVVLMARSTQEFAQLIDTISEVLPKHRLADAKLVRRAEKAAYRSSKLVPGAKCLHRAGATQCWLAIRGVPTRLVIGFRKRAVVEGHAWIEIQTEEGTKSLFAEDPDGFEATWIPV